MSLATFLDHWAKTHPVYDPKTDDPTLQDKVQDYLIHGGEAPLPTLPELRVKK